MNRPLFMIARDIKKDWGSKISKEAFPYLEVMTTLNINDNYYGDSARTIVRRFIDASRTYRTKNARQLKSELINLLGK